jgi:small subunit ribosomal protein S6
MSIRRVYETTIIINAALEDHDIDVVINKVTTLLGNHGGVVEEENRWGRRRLAYAINKKHNGYYVHLIFEATPDVVPVLERFLTLEDTILRHLTLLLSPELRAYRKEKSLAAGKSGETTMSSVVEIEKDIQSGKILYRKSTTVDASITEETIEEEIALDIENESIDIESIENIDVVAIETDENV